MKKFAEKLVQKGPKVVPVLISGTEEGSMLDKYTNFQHVNILDNVLKKQIQNLKRTAMEYQRTSLSAIQIQLPFQIFVMAKDIKPNQWVNPNLSSCEAYDVYINPQILQTSHLQEYGWEQCASFIDRKVKMKRFENIQVQYLNESMEKKVEDYTDFKARVFQHEIDHLIGEDISSYTSSQGEIEVSDELRGIDYYELWEAQKNIIIMKNQTEESDFVIKSKKIRQQQRDFDKLMKEREQAENNQTKYKFKQIKTRYSKQK